MSASALCPPGFEMVQDGVIAAALHPGTHVGLVILNRPAKSNAFDLPAFAALPDALAALQQRDCRACVLLGAGKNFCAGLDLAHLSDTLARQQQQQHGASPGACPARARLAFRREICAMQAAYSALEAARFPCIVAVHGACVGAGVDLITAADIRLATADALLSVKEVDVGITADLGSLQRLPSIVGHGVAIELALTARPVSGAEAASLRLVSRSFESRAALMAAALDLAQQLAAKSPLAVAGTKRILLHTRDQPGVAQGLGHVATYNAAFLVSDDIAAVAGARARKEAAVPAFSKL